MPVPRFPLRKRPRRSADGLLAACAQRGCMMILVRPRIGTRSFQPAANRRADGRHFKLLRVVLPKVSHFDNARSDGGKLTTCVGQGCREPSRAVPAENVAALVEVGCQGPMRIG